MKVNLLPQRIDAAAESIKQSIINGNSITPCFRTISNVLDSDSMNRLLETIGSADESQWTKEQGQEDLPRKKLSWIPDSGLELVHLAMESITDFINSEFTATGEKVFQGISVWQDSEGYQMEFHTDNPIIALAIQIYLGDAPPEYGTSFNVNDSVLELPFVYNTGYILEQVEGERIFHAPTGVTPANTVRTSVYAVWGYKNG